MVRIVYTKGISETAATCRSSSPDCPTDALVQLALANGGITEEDKPWLWRGLPQVWQQQADPIRVQTAHIPKLHEALANDLPIPADSAAWAATTYALQEAGWQGLLDWQDDETWQSAWKERLTAVQADLDLLLEQRTQAVLNQDEAAFLNTAAPHLENAQRRWLADLNDNPVSTFSQTAVPLAFLEDGSVLAQVEMAYELSGQGPSTAKMNILFTPQNDGYLWAGKHFYEFVGDTAIVRYPEGYEQQASAAHEKLTAWTPQAAAMLGISPTLPIEVDLYNDPDDMRAAIALPYHGTNWTEPGQPIKLQANAGDGVLITQLTRHLLGQAGVSDEWLLRGIAANIASKFDGGEVQAALGSSWNNLKTAAAGGRLLDLNYIGPELTLTHQQDTLAQLQSWDAVRYFIHTSGWAILKEHIANKEPIATADFQRTLAGKP